MLHSEDWYQKQKETKVARYGAGWPIPTLRETQEVEEGEGGGQVALVSLSLVWAT